MIGTVFLDVMANRFLHQVVTETLKGDAILDLVLVGNEFIEEVVVKIDLRIE